MKYIKQKIKQNAKRALSWLTALTLILTLVPMFTVNANASGVTQRNNTPLNLTTNPESVPTEGWTWDPDGKVLTLTGIDFVNNTTTNTLTIPANTTIILEGDNNITHTGTSGFAVSGSGEGNFTFTGTGKLTITAGTGTSPIRGINIESGGNLFIENCEIDITTSNGDGINSGGDITIKNATVKVNNGGSSAITTTDGTLRIEAGSLVEVDASRAPMLGRGLEARTITIRDSEIIASGGGTMMSAGSGIIATGGGDTLTVQNSIVTANGGAAGGNGITFPNIIIANSNVTATGGSTSGRGISGSNSITITDSIVNAVRHSGNNMGAIVSGGNLDITRSHVSATGSRGVSHGAITTTDLTTITDSVVTAQGDTGIHTNNFTFTNSIVTARGGEDADNNFGISHTDNTASIVSSIVTAVGENGGFRSGRNVVGDRIWAFTSQFVYHTFTGQENLTLKENPASFSALGIDKFVYIEIGPSDGLTRHLPTPVTPEEIGPVPPAAPPAAAGSVRFTNPDFKDNNEPKEDVDVQARIVKLGANVYMIDIAWGNMKFVFNINSGEWDYDDREYAASQGSWLIDNDEEEEDFEGYLDGENNKVTVTNRSNDGIEVGFDFELETPNLFNDGNINKVEGNFFETKELAKAGALILDTDTTPVPDKFEETHTLESADLGVHGDLTTLPSTDVFFAFSGTPDKGTSDIFQKAGIITVTITPETTPETTP